MLFPHKPTHLSHMARAICLAKKGIFTTDPNPRVGAVIVKNDQIIGEGWHQFVGGPHAELHAIEAAGNAVKGSSCYVTLEPCSHHGRTAPCADAIIQAGIKEVFIAMEDPNPQVRGQGIRRLKAAGIKVTLGLMEAEAKAINPGFIKRMKENRPWVVVKMAMSLDGRTAMANGESQWISCEESRQDVQRLRARSSAIITGSGTLLSDDPRMTVRSESLGYAQTMIGEKVRQPLRVVIDGQQRLSPDSQFFTGEGNALIVLPEKCPQQEFGNDDNKREGDCGDSQQVKAFKHAGVGVMLVAKVNDHLDLKEIIQRLAKDWQINELMVEAGSELSGAFLKQGLMDELHLYIAPKIMGDQAKGLFHLPQLQVMSQTPGLEFEQIRQLGTDIKIICRPKENK